MKNSIFFGFLFLLLCSYQVSLAQRGQQRDASANRSNTGGGNNQLEIIRADSLTGAMGFQRLYGDVRMKNQSTLINCDSAHFYRSQNMAKLYGRVFIEDLEDSVTTRSAYADYDGNTKLAKLRTNVVMTNGETTLYTDYLDFDRLANVAIYFNEGKVVDSTNVLTSVKGRYEINLERITFTEDVILVNPEYTMKTNDLVYLTIPKTAETQGLTNLIAEDGTTLDALKGSFYDTQNKQFRFFEGTVETEDRRVRADELIYRELEAYYEGKKRVAVYNKKREVEVFGDVGKYWENQGYSQVNGNALVRKYFEKDTLFMLADTLISQDNEIDSVQYLLAFHSVRLIKKDLAGIADSLVYNYSDSTIQLFQDPVLWNQKNQLTADSMAFYLVNEELDRAILKEKAFSVMTDTLQNFNQMKGRKMTAYFEEGEINQLFIEGNGESLYYALEGDTLTQGVNRTLSATVRLSFQDGAIRKVNYGVKPDGRFIPVQETDEKSSRLEGFIWREEEKPTMQDVSAWRKVEEIDPKQKNLFDIPDVKLMMPTEEEIKKSLKKRSSNT
ncbi:OstA-like protein [Algoriphagus faecimaris]|uniref:OstA-like protein n=1 Tax=Algoriphagus faecimaris TaxID=686796 RepID=A0A1G6PBU6_9BACT|nr:OstA-like protein [Algoriphagus faecimaris]SDC76897.1 OstA-like protein [Algoriphagus faecimaris]